jgi:hypothetical protein
MRSWLVCLACSQGVPMLRQGDEIGQSASGNNNAYPQDNALSWTDWRLGPDQQALREFARAALALRRAHPELRRHEYFSGARGQNRDVTWLHPHGGALTSAAWADPDQRGLGMWIAADPHSDTGSFLLLLNGYATDLDFRLPEGERFRVLLDSAAPLGTAASELADAVRVRAHASMALAQLPLRAADTQHADPAPLRRLATHYGIADEYLGYHGSLNRTTDSTRVVLLRAMGIAAANSSAIATALRDIDTAEVGLEPVRVLPEGADALREVQLRLRPAHVSGTNAVLDYRLELELESGQRLRR